MFAVLLVFGVVGALVVFATVGATGSHPSKYSYDTPSYTYAPPSYTTASAAATTTTAPTSAATTSRSATTTRTATSTKPAGPQPVNATGDNPLFRDPDAGLINIECGYPRWGSVQAAAQAFFEAARTCLDNMWKPVLQAAGLPFSSPTISVPARSANASSPCSSSGGSFAAFYCSTNHTIYMPLDTIQIEDYGDDSVIYLAVFAHEYGHHVEAITGILDKAHRDRYDAGATSAKGLELSRRTELQAQCFGGMFIGSSNHVGTVSVDQAQRTIQDNYSRGDGQGDTRDHGSKQHYGSWYEHGYINNRTQKCNTWLADASDVS
ncbi:neutral zinc metallopeptidase [Nocardia blacklockiae]|nr:neutral zinc metallopeptidase [Nocardia blacklockiae]